MLAAANPLYGRYNPKLTVQQNINLPAALMSRFDLIFLILDKADEQMDGELARHVAFVHQHARHPDLQFTPYSAKFIRAYISACSGIDPIIPDDLHNYIVNNYVEKRKLQISMGKGQLYITPRTLLGIIRIS